MKYINFRPLLYSKIVRDEKNSNNNKVLSMAAIGLAAN